MQKTTTILLLLFVTAFSHAINTHHEINSSYTITFIDQTHFKINEDEKIYEYNDMISKIKRDLENKKETTISIRYTDETLKKEVIATMGTFMDMGFKTFEIHIDTNGKK